MSLSCGKGGRHEQVRADYTFLSCHTTRLHLRPDSVQAQNDKAGKLRRAGRSFQNIHPASPGSTRVGTSKCTGDTPGFQSRAPGAGRRAGRLALSRHPTTSLRASLLPGLPPPTLVAHSLFQSGPVGRCGLILHQRKQGSPSQSMRC